ncbi:Golgi SNAP receptor complex member 2-like [Lingula anatina]|uniref:Golgi SNAP receptor complex member 2-like n=1 Tax=Lingula anatina TaxID=7574 RepID=A0A1S3J6A9_LINAN|nr:Golgi SNAP receptor complex member 2-like [Lingula anatina]XP_013405786.1 Golgi SNAP receptor complex member 2-like [Lingula anatina]|eukprot:XP_013381887.1 Golgi SNAP receptor complex member 2-like [Lingula anatina]
MDALYHQTNRLVQEVQSELGRLERAAGGETHLLENEIQARIDQIVSHCERLDILVNKEPPTRRPNAKVRVDQLKYDCQHLQVALRNMQHRRYKQEEQEREREELLSQSFTANDDHTSVMIDAAVKHHDRLQSSHRDMDNLLGSGNSILTSLRDQRGTLKGAQRKILDVVNTLGLSNTVMRLIERRTYQDKFILYGGMFVTCVIMFLVYKYLL